MVVAIAQTKSSHSRDKIRKTIIHRMLRTSLWGVLDICLLDIKYEVAEEATKLIDSEYFKPYGFDLKIIDDWNFIQKIPYFKDNDLFIEEHNLYFNEKPSYVAYLAHMNKQREEYAKDI